MDLSLSWSGESISYLGVRFVSGNYYLVPDWSYHAIGSTLKLVFSRVDIWRVRRSCKILVSCVNFSENNANCAEILPENKVILVKYCVKIYPHHAQVNIYAIFMGICKYCVNIHPWSSVRGGNAHLLT